LRDEMSDYAVINCRVMNCLSVQLPGD